MLQPNPRGSYGQGEAFTQANRKDFGYGDLRDILAGVDTVLAKYPVDPNRVGLTGWSYGGFMTMFAVTQTRRFKAAVAGAGISDWLSYYGENSIDQWMIPYFGASVYDDPAVYAKSSAINYIKQAKTPTLVVVGDRDGECPAPQSYEFWHALRDRACADAAGGVSERGAWVCGSGASAGRDGSGGGLVYEVSAACFLGVVLARHRRTAESMGIQSNQAGRACRAGVPSCYTFHWSKQSVFRRPAAWKEQILRAGCLCGWSRVPAAVGFFDGSLLTHIS